MAETGTDLYRRTITYDYGDEDRRSLMKKVWRGTPWMVEVFTDSPNTDRYREMVQWCRDNVGDEAFPIHGRPGTWQTGSATIFGVGWYGFAREEDMRRFIARFGELPNLDGKDAAPVNNGENDESS